MPRCAVAMNATVEPQLDRLVETLIAHHVQFVVIGGFAVVAHRHVRATADSDILIPDDQANDSRCVAALRALDAVRDRDGARLDKTHLVGVAHLRARTSAGLVDVMRGGLAPLDFATAAARAITARTPAGESFLIAGLATLVAFKRLAGRPQDLRDLEALEQIHGALPVEPIPGLDS